MLGPVIGDLLPSAVGVALSPVPIVAVVLILATPRARANGLAFALGWVAGLVVVCTLVMWLTGGAEDQNSDTNTLVAFLQLALGVVLLGVAKKQWDKRPPEGERAELPAWMDAIADFTTGKSLLMGAALAAVNPKNLALTLAGAAAIAEGGLSGEGDAVAIAAFVLIGSATTLLPVVGYLLLGDRIAAPLVRLRRWMAANNATIMTVVCVILAAKLIGTGISGLTD